MWDLGDLPRRVTVRTFARPRCVRCRVCLSGDRDMTDCHMRCLRACRGFDVCDFAANFASLHSLQHAFMHMLIGDRLCSRHLRSAQPRPTSFGGDSLIIAFILMAPAIPIHSLYIRSARSECPSRIVNQTHLRWSGRPSTVYLQSRQEHSFLSLIRSMP